MLAVQRRRRHERTGTSRRCLLAAILVCCGLVASIEVRALAQAPPPAASTDTAATTDTVASQLSAAEVQSEIQSVEASTEIPADQKDAVLAAYRQALDELRLADDWTARASRYRKARETAPTDLEAARKELANPPPESADTIPTVATLDELKQGQATAEAAYAKAQQERNDLDARIRKRTERRDEIGLLDAEAKKRVATIDEQLATPPQADPLARAQRMLLAARRQKSLAEQAAYAEELPSYDATRDLIRAQLDLAARRVNQTQSAAERWKQARAEREKSQANLEAINAQRSVITARPEVERLARKNKQLADERKGEHSPAAETGIADQEAQDAIDEQATLEEQFERVKGISDLGEGTGTLLLRYRDELPDVRQLRQEIVTREKELQRVKLRLMELKSDRSRLEDVSRAAEGFVHDEIKPEPTGPARDDLLRDVTRLLETQREYLDTLIADYEKYFDTLSNELDPAQRQLLLTVTEYSQFINEHILWVRSVEPLAQSDMNSAWAALLWLADPEHWQGVGRTLVADMRDSPLIYGLAFVALGGLFMSQRRLRRRVRAASEMVSESYTTSIWPTFDALGLTILIALFWPLVLWFFAWRLSGHFGASEFTGYVAWALNMTAIVLLTTEFARQVCRKKGLAEVHFAWPEVSLRPLRRNLRWMIVAIVPLAFVVAIFSARGNVAYESSLGRLAYMISMIVLALFVHRTLPAIENLVTHQLGSGRVGWLDGTRFLWYPAAVVAPLVLACLAAAGYYFTALVLTWRVQATVWLAFALLIMHSLALRMLLIARRSVAIRQARERRAQLAKAAESNELAGNDVPVVGETQQIDLSSINMQIRRLLNTALIVTLIVVSWFIWIGVLPALRIFDQWTLWSYDGGNVTVIDLFMSLTFVLLTIVASRNLPGLLEIAWLQRLPLDAGARYAVTSLARYCVTVIGFVAAFQRIGITWSSVQWLAAAVTVGLGFGLQEIFANFVSGLIILFERPMRVGDLVTVNSVSGIVTRIRTRATTITNWDHKELIVPNKEFITGQLINWTLSDTTLRIVLNVGVAYGSDVELTTKLLLKIAAENPNVLDDPPPQVVFLTFGDSTLNFELRVFLPSPTVMVPSQHELNMTIDREFRAANIEIAFPQRDLHVRSIDDTILDRIIAERREKTS